MRIAGAPGTGIVLNPRRDQQWTLGPADEVIVLTTDGSG